MKVTVGQQKYEIELTTWGGAEAKLGADVAATFSYGPAGWLCDTQGFCKGCRQRLLAQLIEQYPNGPKEEKAA